MTENGGGDVSRVVNEALRTLGDKPGPLLLVLHAVQDQLGFIPPEAVPDIARGLNLSRAEVHGVISFYHYFRQRPPGRHTIYLCRAEACQSMRGDALGPHSTKVLGIGFHQTSADGRFSLEPVYCLGNCALAPSMMIDEEVYGRVTPSRFDSIIEQWRGQ